MLIQWNEETMTTGVPEIDIQHQEIINRFNELTEAIAASQMSGLDRASQVLDFLQFYAVWHFEREEECFTKYQCPAAEANKQAHAQFIEMFGQFYEQWQTKGMDMTLAQETLASLGRWIENHIMHTDTQLAPCVRRHQQG